jgi:hypothetical protein
MTTNSTAGHSNATVYNSEDGFENELPTQSIAGQGIDRKKLKTLLRTKFGVGSFEIQTMQNTYYIYAPRALTNVSYAKSD